MEFKKAQNLKTIESIFMTISPIENVQRAKSTPTGYALGDSSAEVLAAQ